MSFVRDICILREVSSIGPSNNNEEVEARLKASALLTLDDAHGTVGAVVHIDRTISSAPV
jgi:hypothetical protein